MIFQTGRNGGLFCVERKRNSREKARKKRRSRLLG
jgi:hypothetical protein